MSGTTLAAQVAEHVPGVAGGGFLVWLGSMVRDWIKRQKPIEDSTSTITDSFVKLTDQLEHRIAALETQIKTAGDENHKLRNDVQKVRAYADQIFRWAARLEEQLRGAGVEPEARPELPVLG